MKRLYDVEFRIDTPVPSMSLKYGDSGFYSRYFLYQNLERGKEYETVFGLKFSIMIPQSGGIKVVYLNDVFEKLVLAHKVYIVRAIEKALTVKEISIRRKLADKAYSNKNTSLGYLDNPFDELNMLEELHHILTSSKCKRQCNCE